MSESTDRVERMQQAVSRMSGRKRAHPAGTAERLCMEAVEEMAAEVAALSAESEAAGSREDEEQAENAEAVAEYVRRLSDEPDEGQDPPKERPDGA